MEQWSWFGQFSASEKSKLENKQRKDEFPFPALNKKKVIAQKLEADFIVKIFLWD